MGMFFRTGSCDHLLRALIMRRYLFPICDKSLPENFFSLEEANVHLDTLSSEITEITDDVEMFARGNRFSHEDEAAVNPRLYNYFCAFERPPVSLAEAPELALRLETAQRDIRKWMVAFANIPVTDENAMEHRLTRIFCFYTWLSVESCQDRSIASMARFGEQFHYIADLIEECIDALQGSALYMNLGSKEHPSSTLSGFAMGTGLVPCICLIIARCQDLSIRQRCLQLLTVINPRGAFYSDNVVAYMQAVVDTAERSSSRAQGNSKMQYFVA